MKKSLSIFISFFICIFLISALVYSYNRYGGHLISAIFQPKLTNQLVGTYTCDENTLCSLTVGPGKAFYFEDYQNDIFLEGTFENTRDNEYLLYSTKVHLSDVVIEEQTVICENLSFSLVLNDFTWKFTKISEIPSKSWAGSFADFVKEYANERKEINSP